LRLNSNFTEIGIGLSGRVRDIGKTKAGNARFSAVLKTKLKQSFCNFSFHQ